MAKVATVITNWFEDVEFTSPKEALEAAGHEVITIGLKAGEEVVGKRVEAKVTVEHSIEDVKPEDYDALLIPGGYSPDKLRANDDILEFVRYFAQKEQPIFSICHAPQLLVNADVIRGKDLTSVKQVRVDVENAGGNFIDQAVVIDPSGLISSRTPDDIPQFNEAIVNALAK